MTRKDRNRKMCQNNRKSEIGKKDELLVGFGCWFTFFLGFGATQRNCDDGVGRY
jgi:hypothetical protein